MDYNSEISALLNTTDASVLSILKTIRKDSENVTKFIELVSSNKLSIDQKIIKKLYMLLAIAIKNDKLNFDQQLTNILQTELNLDNLDDVTTIKDFIKNILQNAKDYELFKDEMVELESGLKINIIKKIYNLYKNKDNDFYKNSLDVLKRNELASVKLEKNPISSKNTRFNTINDEQTKVRIKEETTDIKKEKQDDSGLHLPNKNIDWNELNDLSDLIPKEQLNEFKRPEFDKIHVNKVYQGKIKKIMPFGCFIEILGFKKKQNDGLCRSSEISSNHSKRSIDFVSINQFVYVKVIDIKHDGKILLSMKDIDQSSGKIININFMPLGRGREKEKSFNVKKRKLTSPERWEIRQLIASGAASLDDYPELKEEEQQKREGFLNDKDNEKKNENDQDNNDWEIELNTKDKPTFLKYEKTLSEPQKNAQMLTKSPKGTMSRVAMHGSNLLKEHRETKFQKKKEIEQMIREKNKIDDPKIDKQKLKNEIEDLKKQLVVTSWEREKLLQKNSYGKRTSLTISEQRQSLPIFNMRSELMKLVEENQILVVVGETGSGKTTQITQYLDEFDFSKNGIIGCTQPRRVAAVSVAKRVSEEMGCHLGNDVGYTIRFEDKTSSRTRIKYMTDGMLQREALLDPLMSKYSVIMLDEAHERTIATDILFALLKQAALKRPELKIIVTSATLNSAKFASYFNECPVVNIPGRTFPVEVLYAQSPQMDYIEAALDCVIDIHVNNEEGDILVFLTGQEEIESCCEILYERVKSLGDAIDDLIILTVYSALPSEIQSKIFEPTPKGSRKVVFATNIAETSITIDGIYYVIDPGFSKVNIYNPRSGMEQLIVTPISQAQANQRKGRAGRTGPGKCYRLYTESSFYNGMLPNAVPEIQRQNLTHTILMLKAMGINDLLNFEFMDPPPRNLMIQALNDLYNLQTLDTNGFLTKLGQRMSQFPMDPTLSRALLSSVTNKCSDEIITIISMLSVQSIFYRPKGKQQEADQKKSRFNHPYGDHLTLLNVYTQWEDANYSEKFCETNYLHWRHLKRAKDVRNQICQIFQRYDLPIIKCYGDPDLIRKSIVSGFFMNCAKRDSEVGYKTILGSNVVGIHPSSVLYGKEYDYVLYHSLVLTTKEYMSQVSSIEPHWLLECAPHFYKSMDENSKNLKKMKIAPLHDRFQKNPNSWRLSSIRQNRDKALSNKR